MPFSFFSSHARAVRALVSVSWVPKVLEEMTTSVVAGVEALEDARNRRAVHVGDEMHARPLLRAVLERVAGEARPQVGAADAEVEHVGECAPARAPDAAGAQPARETPHVRQHRRHLPRHVLPFEAHRHVGAQRDVQRRAVLAGVDALACQHLRAPGLELAFARELHEQPHRFGRDALLGIIEQQSVQREAELPEPLGVLREELAQVQAGLGALVLG